jgi:UDP-N-acetylglucosamine enolpyruvyl transferase
MTATERVERQAIQCAEAYAMANGAPRAAAGLVLAGMVIASRTTVEAQQLIVRGYLAQHPNARDPMVRWANAIASAAES